MHPRSHAGRYGLAVLAAVIALAARGMLDAALGPGAWLLAAYAAVAFAAWRGGLGAGLLATLFGVVGGWIVRPDWVGTAFSQHMGDVLLGVSGVLTSLLFERAQREREHVELHDRDRTRTEALLRETVDALAERERVLEAAQRLALIGSWELDLDNLQNVNVNANALHWSEETYRIFGYEPGSVSADNALLFHRVHPDDRATLAERVSEAVRKRKDYQIEHRLLLPGGATRWVEQRGRIVLDAGGRPERILGTCQDITERRRAEAAARERDERLQQIMDAVPALISYVGADARYQLVNQTYERWFGAHPEGVKGRHVCEVLGEAAWQTVRPYMERALAGETVTFEEEVLYRDIGSRWVQVSYTPDCAADGTVRGVIVLVNDIAERKQAEDERARLYASEREARARAEASDNAKDQFLAVLSHELRTPLTPVLTAAQMLETQTVTGDPARVRELAGLIRKNAELEARLIDDLLDLTRVSRGKLSLHYEAVDAHAKVREVLEACARDLELKRLRVELMLDAREHHVRADQARFAQVIWNLIKNAVKFSHPDGRVLVRSRGGGSGELVIEVRDHGVGIDRELLPRLFNAFEQGSREVTRHFGGLGLGLAVSKALVEAQGGTISAASAGKDRGATFTVTMPIARPGAATAAHPGEEQPSMGQAHRILLVEDHEDTSEVMAEFLQSSGYEVKTADTVESALQAADAQSFDLVLSDLGLPDGTGYELMRQLRERHQLRGVALSGYGRDKDVEEARAAGFVEHVTKPPNPQQLLKVLSRVLDGPAA